MWSKEASALRVDFPAPHCIHHFFEAQVAHTPDRVALVAGTRELSYFELNRRANQLAHYLQQLGVGPDTLVGICVERSPEMVIGLLAVLKAGGAYVPVDPDYPTERLRFILQDSQPGIVVTQKLVRERLAILGVQRTYIDIDQFDSEHLNETNPQSEVCSDNLAYIIYTSGSTGQPKGVLLAHRNTANFLHWAGCTFTAQDLAGVLATTSICFDLSVFELFVPLSWGGRVILMRDALHLPTLPLDLKPTLINTVPSVLGTLLKLQDLPDTVRTVNLAGEVLSQRLACQIYRQSQATRLLNLYGPSECTTYSTGAFIDRGVTRSPSIGHPIANTWLHILASSLQPVLPGEVGELYIGGAGLARGYIKRPDLTAERFLPDPFSDEPGARLYKTGDLVRQSQDGELEFVGRVDRQVKLHGFRIELGEIEVILLQHQAVQEALVLVKEEPAMGDTYLICYLVFEPLTVPPTLPEIRRYLQEFLPYYMLPSAFVHLQAFPLTPNGKIDRKRLLASNEHLLPTSEVYIAPRTAIEQEIAMLWSSILGVEHDYGLLDNFFEVGGHSLHALLLASRMREAFHIEISWRDLFDHPTLANLVTYVGDLLRTPSTFETTATIPISSHADANCFPLSPGQQRLWLQEQLVPGSCAYTMPLSLRFEGRLDISALDKALQQVVQRHHILHTRFLVNEGEPFQIIDSEIVLLLEHKDLSGYEERQRQEYLHAQVQTEVERVFVLERGPLLRMTLFRLQEYEHVLLLCMHHIVSDGWSINVLMNDLASLYQASLADRPATLPALPLHYADVARWQRLQFLDREASPQLKYWLRQLHEVPPLLDLPTDHQRPIVPTLRGGSVVFEVSEPVVQALRLLARQKEMSLFMVLLAAFQILLYRYSGQEDFVVGTPIANRNHRETEELIGFFVNTLALRIDFSGNPTVFEILSRVRETCLDAYANQNVSFEQLLKELKPGRSTRYHPLFQTFFVFQNALLIQPLFPGLQVEMSEPEKSAAQFDLTLEITETHTSLRGRLEYSSDLFERDTIVRLASYYRVLVEGIATGSDQQRIDTLPLQTMQERLRMLKTWSQMQGDYH